MTQSLIMQLTAKQEEIAQIQQKIALEQDLDAKMALSQRMDLLMIELGTIRTVYNSWQINELKSLEEQMRGQ